jgi:hypothetical protein
MGRQKVASINARRYPEGGKRRRARRRGFPTAMN